MHEHLKRLVARDEKVPLSDGTLTRRYQEIVAVMGLDPWEGFFNAAEISPFAAHGLAKSKFHILVPPPSSTKANRYPVVDSVAISVYCAAATVFLILGGVHLWHKKLSSFAVDITFWVILFSIVVMAMVQMSVRRSSSDWLAEWVSCKSVDGLQGLKADARTGAFVMDELRAVIELPSASLDLVCRGVRCTRPEPKAVKGNVSIEAGEVRFGNAVVHLDSGDLTYIEEWLHRALVMYFWPYAPSAAVGTSPVISTEVEAAGAGSAGSAGIATEAEAGAEAGVEAGAEAGAEAESA